MFIGKESEVPCMPILRSLAKKMIKTYGKKKAKRVYFALESENKPPFKKAKATAVSRGHTLKHFPKSGKRTKKK